MSWKRFVLMAQGWKSNQLRTYQENQINKTLRLAWKTQGYKKLYGDDVRDFKRLPFVTKRDIRDNLQRFSLPSQDRQFVTTGGSSGIPFGFYRTKTAFRRQLASKARLYHRIGWHQHDKQVVFRGLPINNQRHMQYFPDFNQLRCSSYYLTDRVMQGYVKKIRQLDIHWMKCYPSSGYMFTKYLKQKGLCLPGFKGIFCASQNLYDHQKRLMQQVFGCRVFSHYGHYQLACLAGFCQHEDTYHVFPFYGHAQLIGEDGKEVTTKGQVGEIVATSFLMQSTIFVRYKTGDLATFQSFGCPSCGRPGPVWKKINGRIQQFIVTKSNRKISMTSVNMHDDTFQALKQFQFYQDTVGKLVFNYVPKMQLTVEQKEHIAKRILSKLDNDVQLILNKVDCIEPTIRGKHTFLKQKLNI